MAWLPVSVSGTWLCCGKPSSFSTVLLIAKNMMKPELNVAFFLSYYSKHHKLFTHETQPHFLLKRSFLLSPDIGTSDLEQRPTRWPSGGCHIHSPLPGTGNISAGFSRCPQDALGPAVPTVGTHLRTWDPQSGQPCAPTQSQLPQKHAS